MSYSRKQLIAGTVLAVLAFFSRWLFLSDPTPWVVVVGGTLRVLFYGYVAVNILAHVLKGDEVTADEIYGAICVYLLLGLLWTVLYSIIGDLVPGAFSVQGLGWADFVYYSFSTLTTLGFGDIVPVLDIARSASVIEAVIGTLFLAVTIGRIVALYVTHSTRR